MDFVFADYVTQLTPETPPDASAFDRALQALRKVLIHEMSRRGLWTAPPRYLGVYGGSRWDDGDLLEELLFDCYEFIFVRRLPGLRRQSAAKSSIDGLIFLNVRHFLHDTQRRHDPLGYRIFEIVHGAVERLVEQGTLRVLEGDPKIRNDTVLGFVPWADPATPAGLDGDRVRSWNDALMPELVTAWRRQAVVEAVANRIASLADEDAPIFRFRELVDPLKNDARARWLSMLFEDAELDPAGTADDPLPAFRASATHAPAFRAPATRAPAAVQLPQQAYEERQNILTLLACIARGIEATRADDRSKAYLRRLFDFLRQWSAALEEGPAAGPTPSDKRLGEILEIPRGRIRGLKATLGDLTAACRRGAAVGPTTPHPRPPGALPAPTEGPAMDLEERRRQLRRRTQEMLCHEVSGGPAAGGAADPEPGDSYLFPSAPGVEWLVVERRADERWRLVPVDTVPLAGSRDLELGDAGGEPLVARCALAVRLDAAALGRGSRVRRLAPDIVAAVRRRLDAGSLSAAPTVLEREVDDDSEYRTWSEGLAAAGRRLAERPEAPVPRAPVTAMVARRAPARSVLRGPLPAYGLAAALALAVIGLSYSGARLRQQLSAAEGPFLVPTREAEEIRLGSGERGLEIRLTPAGSHALVYLVFRPRDLSDYPRYRLRLLDAETGDVRWRHDLPEIEERLLVLPLGDSPPRYRLELLGIDAGGAETVLDERLIALETGAAGGGDGPF